MYFSEICGIIVLVAAVVSMQLKNVKAVLVCQLICNGLGAVSYIVSDSISACGIYLLAVLQSIVYFIFRVKKLKPHIAIGIVFVVLYLLCSVFTYETPIDLLAAAAAVTCALAIIQENLFFYRILLLANGVLWLIFDLILIFGTDSNLIAMLINHIITAVSACVGIIRMDLITAIKSKANKNINV